MIISSFRLSFVTDTSLRGEPRPLPNVIKRKFNLGLKLYFCSIVTSFKAFILGLPITNDGINPLHVRESRLRNLGKFCLWNTKSWALDSGIQLKESGIPLTIGIQNRSSTDWQRLESSTWNPESTAWNLESKTVLGFLTWGESPLKNPPHRPFTKGKLRSYTDCEVQISINSK